MCQTGRDAPRADEVVGADDAEEGFFAALEQLLQAIAHRFVASVDHAIVKRCEFGSRLEFAKQHRFEPRFVTRAPRFFEFVEVGFDVFRLEQHVLQHQFLVRGRHVAEQGKLFVHRFEADDALLVGDPRHHVEIESGFRRVAEAFGLQGEQHGGDHPGFPGIDVDNRTADLGDTLLEHFVQRGRDVVLDRLAGGEQSVAEDGIVLLFGRPPPHVDLDDQRMRSFEAGEGHGGQLPAAPWADMNRSEQIEAPGLRGVVARRCVNLPQDRFRPFDVGPRGGEDLGGHAQQEPCGEGQQRDK